MEIECWLGLVSSGILMTHDSWLTVGQPVRTDDLMTHDSWLTVGQPVRTQFSELRGYKIREKSGKNIGLGCSAISRMDSFPAAFSGGCMMLRQLYCYCYDSRFSDCTILLVCVFWGSRVIRSLP